MLQVIKVGGAALADAQWLDRFADAAAVTPSSHRVIVHGGGPEINALSARLGISSRFHDGRRVTSDEALDVTSMVLNGRVNKRIVRALRSRGVDALGISGEDGGLVTGEVTQGGALGHVGDVTSIRPGLLHQLVALGLVPVVSPVSLSGDCEPLNINADEVATAVAQQMAADELLFLTDVNGVRVDNSELGSISAADAQQLIARQVATGGMAVKLRAAIAALAAGVAKVRVGPLDMLWDADAGTTIRAEVVACR